MNYLQKGWIKVQLRPRVIHRIPGRIRIHIPALKKVDSSFHKIASKLINGFELPATFEYIKVNYISGNILVVYKKDKTDEHNVMNWIFDLRDLVEKIMLKFIELEPIKSSNAEKKLFAFFEKESNNGTLIDKNFVIPNEIWN